MEEIILDYDPVDAVQRLTATKAPGTSTSRGASDG
jgi:hypothetical protein